MFGVLQEMNIWIFFYVVGHFLPEEDDKYLERVKAAVEEEERQAATAARTDAVKDAILTAEESRKAPQNENHREDGSGPLTHSN